MMIRLVLLICACASGSQARGQASNFMPYVILDGTAKVLMPDGDFKDSITADSIRYEASARTGEHRFVVTYYPIEDGIDREQLLRASAQAYIDEAPENATVNYDLVEGACYAGAELSLELWTPVTKPMGLRYSMIRLYIIDNYFLSLSVQGLGVPVDEGLSSRFFESLTVSGGSDLDCSGME